MKTKEIIGYKLKDEKYIEPVKHITGVLRSTMSRKFDEYGYHISNNVAAEDLKEFKVLDLWFEPVYKEEPELEVGRWYKHETETKNLLFIEKVYDETSTKCYGFTYRSEWMESADRYMDGNYIPATDAEVEKALIQEATKRGFKEGVTVKECLSGLGEDERLQSNNFYFSGGDLWVAGEVIRNTCIFADGQWAEIKEQPKEENIIIFPKSMEGKLTIKYQ